MTRIVRCISMFVNLMKTILNLAIEFKKEYNETLVARSIVEIVKSMMSADFLTKTNTQSYYRYIRFARNILRYKSVNTLVKSRNGDDGGSKRLGISHLDYIGLYAEAKKALPVLN